MVDLGPFHSGEITVQERTGEREDAVRRGGMIRDGITPPARVFLGSQRSVAFGAVGKLGRPWASLWLGAPGFVTSYDGLVVRVSQEGRVIAEHDPMRSLLLKGRPVGVLAIDLGSRRRLRINGEVAATSDAHLDIIVREVFPNCTKYIQQRELVTTPLRSYGASPERGERLDTVRRDIAASVDTVFVASYNPARGVDVSHRGGARGFVRVLDERTVRFPDYPGNSMFQTLGNFEIEPRAGVLMVDFQRARFLSMTGSVTMSFGSEDADHPSGGTGRYWDFAVETWLDFPMPAEYRLRFVESSPYNPPPHTAGGDQPLGT
jgi:hypothetical protein